MSVRYLGSAATFLPSCPRAVSYARLSVTLSTSRFPTSRLFGQPCVLQVFVSMRFLIVVPPPGISLFPLPTLPRPPSHPPRPHPRLGNMHTRAEPPLPRFPKPYPLDFTSICLHLSYPHALPPNNTSFPLLYHLTLLASLPFPSLLFKLHYFPSKLYHHLSLPPPPHYSFSPSLFHHISNPFYVSTPSSLHAPLWYR